MTGLRRVLAFGTYDREKHPRVAVIIDGLRENGVRVVEVDEPLQLSTADKVAMMQHPSRLPHLAGRILRCWTSLVVRSLRLRGPFRPDAILVGYMGHFDVVLARLLYPRTPILLDHLIFAASTAADRGECSRVKLLLMRLIDMVATRTADVIILDTEEHRARLPEALRGRGVVVPVGAQRAWRNARRLAAPSRAPQNHELSIIFYGLFTPLQGATVIARALRLLEEQGVGFHAKLIGSGQDSDAVRAELSGATSVEQIDWVPATELPALVAEHDVCLGIFGTTDKARSVVPNKVYQGLAAGCAVVTSDTPPQRRILRGAAVLTPAGDAEALAEALRELAENPDKLAAARDAARKGAGRFAPAAVVETLLPRIPGRADTRR